MNEESKKRIFGAIGDSIDRSFQAASEDFRKGGQNIGGGFATFFDAVESLSACGEDLPGDEDPIELIVNVLMQRINQIAEPVGADFSYSTILRWVKKNAVGNRFYLLKHIPANSNISYIFVFFADNKNVMLAESDSIVCYMCKQIPESILSLFGNKQVFIQPFE